MNKFIFSMLLLVGFIVPLHAGGPNGAEMTYRDLDSGKILIIAKFYRDCRGIALNAPTFGVYAGVNGSNSCFGYSLTFTRVSIKDVTPVCSTSSKPCYPANTGGTGEGIEVHTYLCTLDLNSTPLSNYKGKSSCAEITFYAGSCCRSGAITTGPAGNDFWVTCSINIANLNRCKYKKINAPVFTNEMPAFMCCNTAFQFNPGLKDSLDHDSITYRLAPGLSTLPNTSVSYTSPFTYQYPMTPYCIPNTTIKCTPNIKTDPPRGFFMDSSMGDIIFTPTNCNEVGIIVVDATEWRKDTTGKYVAIGRVRKDIQTIVKDDCGYNNAPKISGPENYVVCAGDKICFDINITDKTFTPYQTTPDTVIADWNGGITGATFKITNPKSREKTAQFCWQTDSTMISDVAYTFIVIASDQHCPKPSLASKSFSVKVKKRMAGSMNKSLLPCNKIAMYGSIPKGTGQSFAWNIIDSASGKSVFTSSQSKDTTQSLKNGTYFLQLNLATKEYCYGSLYDTVRIAKALPYAELGSSFNVCQGNSATVSPQYFNAKLPCKNTWYLNGTHNISDTNKTFTITIIRNKIKIDLFVKDADGCPFTATGISVDTFPMPLVKWNKSVQDPRCYSEGNFMADSLVLLPEKTDRSPANFKIKGALGAFGKYGLIDSLGGTQFMFNAKKINNISLQNNNSISETLTVWYKDKNGCENSAQTIQRINGNPIIDLLTKSYCQNAYSKINLDSCIISPKNKTGLTVQWNCLTAPKFVDKTQVIYNNGAGLFEFRFGSAGLNQYAGIYSLEFCASNIQNSCSVCDTTSITLIPEPTLIATSVPTACYGSSNIDLLNTFLSDNKTPLASQSGFRIVSLNGNNDSLNWGGATIKNKHFLSANNKAGIWFLQAANNSTGCSAKTDVKVIIYPKPQAFFTTTPKDSTPVTFPFFEVKNGSSITPTSPLDFTWIFDMRNTAFINSTAVEPQIAYPGKDETYRTRLITISDKGCKDTFYRILKVGKGVANGVSTLEMKDLQINQRFVVNSDAISMKEIRIYDLAGKLVYESDNNQGTELKPGIYTYVIEVKINNGNTVFIKGRKMIE